MPMMKEGGKVLAKHALGMGANVLADVSRGENNVGESLKKHGINAAMGAAEDVLAPDKRKKRRGERLRTPQTKRLKGRKFADIYDD